LCYVGVVREISGDRPIGESSPELKTAFAVKFTEDNSKTFMDL
jgi:hypothetical protein